MNTPSETAAVPRYVPTHAHSSCRGFTLPEVLLAFALGSMLLVALSGSAGLYGSQVAAATADFDTDLEAALEEINIAVGLAWTVERPTATSLLITDPAGRATTYEKDGSVLKVTRPSGASGVLVEDVSSLSFAAETTRRLRDIAPLDSYGLWYDSTPNGPGVSIEIPILGSPVPDALIPPYYDPTPSPGLLLGNDAIALSFTIPAAAPAGVHPIPDVKEQMLRAALERLLLPLSYLPVLPNIPAQPAIGGHTICHYPPGNKKHGQTLTIGLPAVPVHEDHHSDTMGPCVPSTGVGDTITIGIYESGASDDAIPVSGPALAIIELVATSLPAATWRFTGVTYSPVISFSNPKLEIDVPTTAVPLDMTGLGPSLEPGTPFTMVLRFNGHGCLVFSPHALASTVNSGVAMRREGELVFSAQDWDVDFLMDGMRTFTQTSETEVITHLISTIDLNNGRTATGTSLVTSQSLAINPWHGQVPGESPTLQLIGQ